MSEPLTDEQYNALRRRGEALTIRAAQLVQVVAALGSTAVTTEAALLHADIADYTQLITGEAWLTFIRPDQSAQKPAAPTCADLGELPDSYGRQLSIAVNFGSIPDRESGNGSQK